MPNTALITGASAGLGTEFARYHAERGGDVILTARRADALEALKSELVDAHGITAHVMALDLGQPGAAEALHDQVKALGVEIDILINNAGFGGQGAHLGRPLADEKGMIELNVMALVTLTHLFGNDMAARGGGHILNVGSTAGFGPGPNQAVYFATKNFVNAYSMAVNHELLYKGVGVTLLAPGYVETEFAKAADLEGTALVRSGGASSRDVARFGYDAMLKNKLIVINDWKLSFLLNWIAPFLPRRMLLNTIAKAQAK